MPLSCRYLALYVPDLEAAETFYRSAFGLELLFRESEQDDGWYSVRDSLDWSEIGRRGIPVAMVALQRNDFVLALFRGSPSTGTVYEICLAMDATEVDATIGRLPEDAVIEESEDGWLRFVDPFGFRWAVCDHDLPFLSSGEIAERWIG